MYIKTNWLAKVGTGLNRFLKSDEDTTHVTLSPDPTGISQAGTPFTVDNMNHIEDGIYDAHYPEFTEAETLQNINSLESIGTLWGKVKKAISEIINKLGQAVNTDSDVKFNSLSLQVLKLKNEQISFFPTSIIKSSFASPSSTPTGLTFDGTNLISCDASNDTIYVHDGVSSTILSSFASPSSTPTGLTFDGTNLISCDADSDTIYVHDGVSSTILSSFSIPSSNPNGLTFDGTNLISCDASNDTIYIHDGVSSTILSSFASPSSVPNGLAFGGTNLISCDASNDTIYIHDGVSLTILSSFASPSSAPTGLAFDGTNLISCDADSDTIYVHYSNIAI
jgi:hypothetical protein